METINVLREHHKWHSQKLNREMELLVFGHAGARVIIFPTSMGRFFDWEDRKMIETMHRHLENGWIQIYCVDSVDSESWYNKGIDPKDRAHRHIQYQDYIVHEVLPFAMSKNDNPFTMAVGASFGGYHAINIGLRYPDAFSRVIAMSGICDINDWTQGSASTEIWLSNPCDYMAWLDDGRVIDAIRKVDIIIAIGKDDPNFGNNKRLSDILWQRNIWHAFRAWDGWAHDWQYWQEMMLQYIGGPDSRD